MTDEVVKAFQDVLDHRKWGDGESLSGTGSSKRVTAQLVPQLIDLVGAHQVRTMVDAPCGDFNWIGPVASKVQNYIGLDIVPDVVERAKVNAANEGFTNTFFSVANIIADDLPNADLYLVRDCLVHLTFAQGMDAIENVRRHTSLVLFTTFPDLKTHIDVPTGRWRPLNLQLPPYNLPEPIAMLVERPQSPPHEQWGRKCLGLWRGR